MMSSKVETDELHFVQQNKLSSFAGSYILEENLGEILAKCAASQGRSLF